MTISAKIVADSVSPAGKRITTMQLRYPRFIHAEFMTHRVFSRNASSSRAIPVEKLIEDIRRDTAMPIHWGKNQPGMQAREENDESIALPELEEFDTVFLDDEDDDEAGEWVKVYRYPQLENSPTQAWCVARDRAIEVAQAFHKAGYHKQVVNRLLEPFSHINVLVTATEWDNFFALRAHPDAQPEIHELALQMKAAMEGSEPRLVDYDCWHLPYVFEEEREILTEELALKVSVARCARVSYLTHEGKRPEVEKDLELYERLVGSEPIHASPAEHQATPLHLWDLPSGNFYGWFQFRQSIEAMKWTRT